MCQSSSLSLFDTISFLSKSIDSTSVSTRKKKKKSEDIKIKFIQFMSLIFCMAICYYMYSFISNQFNKLVNINCKRF